MEECIKHLVEESTDEVFCGEIYIIYERLDDLYWLPWDGDGKTNRAFKHWILVVSIGFDSYKIEYREDKYVSKQGVVLVSEYNPDVESAKRYLLSKISIDAKTFFKELLTLFSDWNYYSIKRQNCQHFVHGFLEKLKYCIVDRTRHLRRLQNAGNKMVTMK
ncbi:hypothetical protein EC957_001242 [Mortierella hygrophila]|uniref:Uncharacterized protein n=1 Tax=Mortierella hygrophila TaxID=979708 RepID=A0A9P6K2L1_9FUNG|nr:hypothetical protein EC957_001242 [Mortierella hygrophila]